MSEKEPMDFMSALTKKLAVSVAPTESTIMMGFRKERRIVHQTELNKRKNLQERQRVRQTLVARTSSAINSTYLHPVTWSFRNNVSIVFVGLDVSPTRVSVVVRWKLAQ